MGLQRMYSPVIRTLDVSDNRSSLVVQKLHADLNDTTTGASSTENLYNAAQLRDVLLQSEVSR